MQKQSLFYLLNTIHLIGCHRPGNDSSSYIDIPSSSWQNNVIGRDSRIATWYTKTTQIHTIPKCLVGWPLKEYHVSNMSFQRHLIIYSRNFVTTHKPNPIAISIIFSRSIKLDMTVKQYNEVKFVWASILSSGKRKTDRYVTLQRGQNLWILDLYLARSFMFIQLCISCPSDYFSAAYITYTHHITTSLIYFTQCYGYGRVSELTTFQKLLSVLEEILILTIQLSASCVVLVYCTLSTTCVIKVK